jgi:hypothetical protein
MVQNYYEPDVLQGKTVNSHNPKTESVIRTESVRITRDQDEVRVIKSRLHEAAELSISEDDDVGSDPYNSTGQHVVIKSMIDPQD